MIRCPGARPATISTMSPERAAERHRAAHPVVPFAVDEDEGAPLVGEDRDLRDGDRGAAAGAGDADRDEHAGPQGAARVGDDDARPRGAGLLAHGAGDDVDAAAREDPRGPFDHRPRPPSRRRSPPPGRRP